MLAPMGAAGPKPAAQRQRQEEREAAADPQCGWIPRANMLPQLTWHQQRQPGQNGDPIAEALRQKGVQQGRSRIAHLLMMELLHPGELSQLTGGGGERETLKPDPGLSATGVSVAGGAEQQPEAPVRPTDR